MAEQRGALGQVLRLDEQLAEGRVGQVVGGRGEDDLGVARDLDLARTIAVVGHRQPAHLDVVLGRDRDVELGGDVVVAAVEGRLLREEGDQVVLRLLRRGLEGGRPDRAAAHVAQVEELAARIAGRILAVPRDRAAPTEAGAAAGVGHHRGVVAVGQELRVGEPRVRRAEAADREGRHGAGGPRLLDRSRLGDRGLARDALLQQQLRGLHARVGVEALHHRIAEQGVGERHQGHALVMGHEGPHHRARGGRRARGRRCRARRSSRGCSRWPRRSRKRPRALPRPGAAGSGRPRSGRAWRRAPWRRARPPARRPGRASGRGRGRRRPCTDSCRAGPPGCRRTPRCPRARRDRARTRSAAARPSGTSGRAASPDSSS